MNSKTILVVDDDLGIRVALHARLEHAGYAALCASDGAQALELAKSAPIDAIALDVAMPGELNGLAVAAALRKHPSTAKIPIVFITGSADHEFKRKCEEVGGKYFLAKPYDPDLLLQTLRSIFGEDELAQARRISQAKRRQPVG